MERLHPAPPAGHLTFALRYEGLDLAVLRALFRKTGPEPIADMVRAAPTGGYARRLWFLYDWLLDTRLDLPDAAQGTYALVVDPKRQFAVRETNSTRHRVKNNLPGTPAFCPMIFRTPALEAFIGRGLGNEARQLIAEVPAELLARTAAFLLLKDSRSSFQIELGGLFTWMGEAGWIATFTRGNRAGQPVIDGIPMLVVWAIVLVVFGHWLLTGIVKLTSAKQKRDARHVHCSCASDLRP